ncbi:MAG: hypothetical protein ABJL64_07785 [Rhizobiaceae bacterium]
MKLISAFQKLLFGRQCRTGNSIEQNVQAVLALMVSICAQSRVGRVEGCHVRHQFSVKIGCGFVIFSGINSS